MSSVPSTTAVPPRPDAAAISAGPSTRERDTIRALRQRVKALEEEAKRDKAALRARRIEEPWAGTEDVMLDSAAKDLAAFFSRVHFGCLMGWGLLICRIHERYSLFVLFILAQPERHEVSVIVTREPRSAADP